MLSPKLRTYVLTMSNRQYLEYLAIKKEGSPHFQTFNVNDNVEILSQGSGSRGCWFRCKSLRVSLQHLRVEYCDRLDENVTEYVSSHRVANPDELDMRHAGRLTVRPLPSEGQCNSTKFNIGSALDAWWGNGWWEGVFIGYESSSPNNLQLFFPGEKKFLTIERKNVRASKHWIDGKWKRIKPNPNIFSYLSSIPNPTPQSSPPPAWAGTNNSTPVNRNTHNINRCQTSRDSSASSSKAVKTKATSELHYKKRLIIRYINEQDSKKSKTYAEAVTTVE